MSSVTDEGEDKGRRAMQALVQGVMATGGAAGSVVHPDLAIPLAGIVAAVESVVTTLLDRVNPFRRGQISKAMAAGCVQQGVDPVLLAEDAVRTERRQLITADMLEAAARTAYEAKVVALGRAWARGVAAKEEAVLAIEQQFIRTVSRLEMAHARVLGVVARTPMTGKQRRAVVTGWEELAVMEELPEYGKMVGQLLAVLSSEGLIADMTIQNPLSSGTQFRITASGRDILDRLAQAEQT